MTMNARGRGWRVALPGLLGLIALGTLLAGCAAPRQKILVDTPTTARPPMRAPGGTPSGGIFGTSGYRPLFEDRKPRYVGDLLTIQLNEKLDASQKAANTTQRTDDGKISTPGLSGILALKVPSITASAGSSNKFDSKGENASSNALTGTITATVIEVLMNGNLVISAEKQIGIRQNSEILRLSGVVDPAQIQPGNSISSTQLADVRIDYRGGGNVEEALIQGWFSRFFNSFSPW